MVNEAIDCMNRSGQHLPEAVLQRIKADLLVAVSRDNEAEAEDCFCHAIAWARRQSAKSPELSVALSRLWRRQGKSEDARALLAEICGWFTEGFETPDLKEAKALLGGLR